MKNKILLTYDYEIYFDGRNSYKAMIEKTAGILKVAFEQKVKLIFFVDIVYIIKIKQVGLSEAYTAIKAQVETMKKDGHEIQFHFHPHWIHSVYHKQSDSWEIRKDEFSFSDICKKYGIEFAKKNMKEALDFMKSQFKVVPSAYRAGGLSIGDNQDTLISFLNHEGFKFDSSVMPKYEIRSKYVNSNHQVTFNKDHWAINEESGFFKETNQNPCLTEIPIMVIPDVKLNMITKLFHSTVYRLLRLFNRSYGKIEESGKPIDLEINYSFRPNTITFDKSKSADTYLLTRFTSLFFKEKQIMCMLSHPKSFIEGGSNKVMRNYLFWLKRNKIDIVGFNDLGVLN